MLGNGSQQNKHRTTSSIDAVIEQCTNIKAKQEENCMNSIQLQ